MEATVEAFTSRFSVEYWDECTAFITLSQPEGRRLTEFLPFLNDWAAMCIQRRTEFLPFLNGWATMCIQRQTTCLRWCSEGALFAMVLRRLGCLQWECSGKQSKQMVVRLFGMVLRIFESHTSSLDSYPWCLDWLPLISQHHHHRTWIGSTITIAFLRFMNQRAKIWIICDRVCGHLCVCLCLCLCLCLMICTFILICTWTSTAFLNISLEQHRHKDLGVSVTVCASVPFPPSPSSSVSFNGGKVL